MKKRAVKSDIWDRGFYKPGITFFLQEFVKLIVLSLGIGLAFFDSLVSGALVLPFMYLILRIDIQNYEARQKNKLAGEFRDLIVCMAGNLGAGYALDTAFVMAIKDVKKQDEKSLIGGMEAAIINELSCNVPLAVVLRRLSEKSRISDMQSLSNMIITSKKYGGDIVYLIRQYARKITEQTAVNKEIETMIASKRMEGKIMTAAPFMMVFYMRFGNSAYMNMLYDTPLGRIIMVICLAVIYAAVFMTNKITRIEV